MGFKFKRVDLTAGSSDWPVGDEYIDEGLIMNDKKEELLSFFEYMIDHFRDR